MLDDLISDIEGKTSKNYQSDWDLTVERHYTKLWSLVCDQKRVKKSQTTL